MMIKVFSILVLCAACALAQDVTFVQKADGPGVSGKAFGQIGMTVAFAGPMESVPGQPYSAQIATERVQVLADGNRIEQTTSGSVARDSQGRTRREESLSSLSGDAGQPMQMIMIDDPVAHVHWSLDPQRKTAMKLSLPAGKSLQGGAFTIGVPAPPPPPPPPAPGAGAHFFTRFSRADDADAVKTDLGMQTVEGVPAQGTRIVRTIPAGKVGNQLPIVITTETWYSPDLKVLVMSKVNDPRMGETTYKLTNIDRSEPAASLFQVPDDYTVSNGPTIKGGPGGNVIYQSGKKN
jgi:hypothetical protein